MEYKLPEFPEPTEIEIELTNYCNANCVACPRDELTAEKGYMQSETFYSILNKYEIYRERISINKLTGGKKYPILTFAGMGEPLLHKEIFEFIRYARKKDFYTVIFTNASLMDEACANELVNSGINHIFISFWGIKEDEYTKSMGLNYKKTLKNVEYLSSLAIPKKIPITIIWVKTEFIQSTAREIQEFWDKRGIMVDCENDPWNRGGYLKGQPSEASDFKNYPGVDFQKEIWCSQLFFTDTICWNGDLIICSCDYYKKENTVGNLLINDPWELAHKKLSVLNKKQKVDICTQCKKPDRNYFFASEPWDQILDEHEKRKYTY
ncbi:MAG: radical SAM protein [Clostridia bacterium]|nr:radical SAM protein [Clostridia bacterium]